MAVAAGLGAAWTMYETVDVLRETDFHSVDDIAMFLLFDVGICGGTTVYLAWLATRLWSHFSATTVRWASATVIAALSLFAMSGVDRWTPTSSRWVDSTLSLLLVVAVPFAYRWLTRTIIARTPIEDPVDLLGQPLGHATRVKVFCIILGWATFLAVGDIVRALGNGISPSIGALPLLLGWLTYRIVLWWMTPATRVALPPGGFEVLPRAEPQNHASSDA